MTESGSYQTAEKEGKLNFSDWGGEKKPWLVGELLCKLCCKGWVPRSEGKHFLILKSWEERGRVVFLNQNISRKKRRRPLQIPQEVNTRSQLYGWEISQDWRPYTLSSKKPPRQDKHCKDGRGCHQCQNIFLKFLPFLQLFLKPMGEEGCSAVHQPFETFNKQLLVLDRMIADHNW